ncbi:hypothetical protein HDU84_008796 [Entophlyctis sp. JEL0112]|nr:hypothetical protein HDU84_008796 [Entophlyctis sp. JEL0112]
MCGKKAVAETLYCSAACSFSDEQTHARASPASPLSPLSLATPRHHTPTSVGDLEYDGLDIAAPLLEAPVDPPASIVHLRRLVDGFGQVGPPSCKTGAGTMSKSVVEISFDAIIFKRRRSTRPG